MTFPPLYMLRVQINRVNTHHTSSAVFDEEISFAPILLAFRLPYIYFSGILITVPASERTRIFRGLRVVSAGTNTTEVSNTALREELASTFT